MKKTIITLLGCMALSVVVAEPTKTTKEVICDNRKDLFEWLQTNEYQEKPTWLGDNPLSNTKLAILSNKDTGTWTIIEFDDSYACVVSIGINSKLVPTKPVGLPI